MCHDERMSGRVEHRTNTDEEIVSRVQDELDRRNFAERIAHRMTGAGAGPSVVFGLAGPWGSGKSSTLNMIQECFEEKFDDEWAIARLTPWSATDIGTLFDEFYSSVAGAMPDTEPGRTAARKLRAMAPVGVAVGKAVGRALIDKYVGEGASADIADAAVGSMADAAGEFRFNDDAFVTRFMKVSQAIRAAERNVLVMVDDVDRLHVDELLSLFKAVRLLGRFDCVHYVLSYDETTILDVLESSDIAKGNRERAAAYLEKIIQYPFVLPPIQEVQLREHILRSLTEVAGVHDVSLDPRDEDRPAGPLQTIIESIPKAQRASLTLRAVNRLASQVDIFLTLVGPREVDFVDAVLLTFLRLYYRDLYHQLPIWRSDLTGAARLSFSSHDSVDWKGRITTAVNRSGTEPIVEDLYQLLSASFPRVRNLVMSSDPDGCRVCQSEYFPRYFTLGIPVGDVSDSQVRAEFETLCKTGELQPESAITAALTQRDRWSPVLGKARRNLGMIDKATPETAFAAALALGGFVLIDIPALSNWLPVVALFLERAVKSVDDVARSQSFVNRFRQEFGLIPTAHTLAEFGRRDAGTDSAMILASQSVRDEVLAACMRDLMRDVSSDNPDAPTLLRFAGFLDDDLLDRLRRFAAQELAEGRTSVPGLAGRFLRLPQPHFESGDPYILMSQAFASVVPLGEWRLEMNPDEISHGEYLADGSLPDRIRFAQTILKEAVGGGVNADSVAYEKED